MTICPAQRSEIGKHHEEEFTRLVEDPSAIIEPLMIVIFEPMIGVMVVALYLPIFSLGEVNRWPSMVDFNRQINLSSFPWNQSI